MSSAPKSGTRSPRDLYVTPQGVTAPLLAELDAFMPQDRRPRILDAGAGPGELTRSVLERWPAAYVVAQEQNPEHLTALEALASEVIIGDFLDFEAKDTLNGRGFDLVIANPPYSAAQAFLERALALPPVAPWVHPVVALLVNLNFMGSDGRADFFNEHRPDAMRVLAPRPSFTASDTGKLQTDSTEYAWVVWVGHHSLEPFGWYVWRETAQRAKRLAEAAL